MERKKPLEMAEQERRDGRGNTGDLTPREAAAFLRSRDNFLIVTHVRPDGDTLGCGAALCRVLRGLGKTAAVLPNDRTSARYTPYMTGLWADEACAPDTVVTVDLASKSMFTLPQKVCLPTMPLPMETGWILPSTTTSAADSLPRAAASALSALPAARSSMKLPLPSVSSRRRLRWRSMWRCLRTRAALPRQHDGRNAPYRIGADRPRH